MGPTAATSLKLLLLPLVLLTASGFILRAFVSALRGVAGGGGFEPASCCLKMLSRANRRQRGETAGRGALRWGHLTTVAPAERETNQARSRRQQQGSSQHSTGSALMALPLLPVRWSLLKFLFRMLFYFIVAEPCRIEIQIGPCVKTSFLLLVLLLFLHHSSSPRGRSSSRRSNVLHFYCLRFSPHILYGSTMRTPIKLACMLTNKAKLWVLAHTNYCFSTITMQRRVRRNGAVGSPSWCEFLYLGRISCGALCLFSNVIGPVRSISVRYMSSAIISWLWF